MRVVNPPIRPAVAVALALLPAGRASARVPTDAEVRALRPVLEAAVRALRSGNEARFRACFHPDGYAANLAGRAGRSGAAAFRASQGRRIAFDFWWPKSRVLGPEVVRVHGALRVGRARPITTYIDLALVKHQGRWVVLGGSEVAAEVGALLARWIARRPLAPPPER